MRTSRPLLNLQSHNLWQQDIFGPEGHRLSGRFTFPRDALAFFLIFPAADWVPQLLGIINSSTINS
jgi:hypothetical protein